MTSLTNELKIVMIQCDVRIIHIRLVNHDLVMNYIPGPLMAGLAKTTVNADPLCDV